MKDTEKKEDMREEKASGYTNLDVSCGLGLDKVIETLVECNRIGERVSVNFSGIMLYSDKVDEDQIYLDITGKNKEEFNVYKSTYIRSLMDSKVSKVKRLKVRKRKKNLERA